MSFDDIIDRRGQHSMKWDMMEPVYGVSAETGIAMWVADMDFRPPEAVAAAVARMHRHGIYGYYGDDASYREAIRWWMEERHGWALDPAHLLTTAGMVNAVALAVDTFSEPGDAVVLFTPVYHAFERVIRANGRNVHELQLALENGTYVLDWDVYEAQMTGAEKVLIWCSPHNPGGRVWSRDELEQVAAFARRHDLLIVSDEIHHDLIYSGHTHTPFALLDDVEDRLVMMTAATKTFNIAGAHIAQVTIADDDLRRRYARRMAGLGIGPNAFGLTMVEAAYSVDGAAWVDALMEYLDGNRQLFDAVVADIPGLASMPLESTYLSWVDHSGTGMSHTEVLKRIEKDAAICVNHGPTFGKGGETFLRFNIGLPRARLREACTRLADAFADLQ